MNSTQQYKPYLNRKLTFSSNGDIYDDEGQAVMMGWEKPIMEEASKIICSKGGDVLNVGYGMGLIDSCIENHSINSHWIIEAHPDIQHQILKKGWLQKPHVKPIFGKWQNIYSHLPKFDGIYIDTYEENLTPFFENVHKLLKPGGIFSWFYNDDILHKGMADKDLFIISEHFKIKFVDVTLNKVDNVDEKTGYWDPQKLKAKVPFCTLKN